jgi:hypothetical protein
LLLLLPIYMIVVPIYAHCAGTNNDPILLKCRLISISVENGVLAQEN